MRTLASFSFAMLALLVAASACSDASARSPLANARSSERALIDAVLDALKSKDQAALEALLVSRSEYETLLWPELPDTAYTSFDFVWGLARANSRKGLRQLLGRYGGFDLEVVSIELGEEREVHHSFTMYMGVDVVVRRRDTGESGTLPSIDVLVEYGGRWKLMNYDEL